MLVTATNRDLSHAAMAAAEVFQSRHWEWAGRGGMHVPDIEEIVQQIDHLTDVAYEQCATSAEGYGEAECGRFMVRVYERTIGAEVYLKLGTV